MTLFFIVAVACVLGALLGLPSSYRGILPGVLMAMLVTVLSSVLTYVGMRMGGVISPTVFIGEVVLALGVFSGIVLYRRRFVEFGLDEALGILSAGVTGILIGVGLPTEAVVVGGVFVCILLVLSWMQDRRMTDYSVYTLSLELPSLSALEDVNRVLKGLSLSVVDKSLLRGDGRIYYTVVYRSTPLLHHLCFKKMASIEGVSDIRVG
jgi:uncharacterized membrane protein YhiD involved in acid resistance